MTRQNDCSAMLIMKCNFGNFQFFQKIFLYFRYEHEEFVIEPPNANIHYDEINGLVAKFEDMVAKIFTFFSNLEISSEFRKKASFEEIRSRRNVIACAITFG